MRWALIEGGRVANVVEQADKPRIGGQWVACGDAGPGWTWAGGVFSNPDAAPPAPTWVDADLDPRYWWINVGPFFDRFGPKALAIVSSADDQVRGVVQLCMPRQYIDLKRADLPVMVGLLVLKGIITEAEKTAALTAPTTDYERHIKGLPQPA